MTLGKVTNVPSWLWRHDIQHNDTRHNVSAVISSVRIIYMLCCVVAPAYYKGNACTCKAILLKTFFSIIYGPIIPGNSAAQARRRRTALFLLLSQELTKNNREKEGRERQICNYQLRFIFSRVVTVSKCKPCPKDWSPVRFCLIVTIIYHVHY